ncbi:ABC transporter ATP-binding protein, partial [Novosphingobium sp. SCN 63-17]
IIMFALDILPALTFLVGGLMLAQGLGVSIGTLVALIALQEQLLWPLLELFEARVELRKARALLTRVFGTLDTKPTLVEPANPVSLNTGEIRGEICFENVSFAYPASERQTLDHIWLRIAAGTHTAIVGSTGSGKSTLGYLIARLYDPDSGRVTLDGIDLRDMSFESLSQLLGVVTQDPFLLNASIEENLRFAKPEASQAELRSALELAQLSEKVASLPQGLRTEVGERGYQFSGGERQRLSLARTILRDPTILLLDEATSALDPQTENALSAALAARHNRTVVSIAHRLSTVRHADQIVVLEQGRIVEMGNHDQLIAANGRYRQLASIG